jgi:hypothetical protein
LEVEKATVQVVDNLQKGFDVLLYPSSIHASPSLDSLSEILVSEVVRRATSTAAPAFVVLSGDGRDAEPICDTEADGLDKLGGSQSVDQSFNNSVYTHLSPARSSRIMSSGLSAATVKTLGRIFPGKRFVLFFNAMPCSIVWRATDDSNDAIVK